MTGVRSFLLFFASTLLALSCLCGCGKDARELAARDRVRAESGSACLSCHEGVEHFHSPLSEQGCTLCHGGDDTSYTKQGAHVNVPASWVKIRGDLPEAPHGYIKDFSADQLSALPKEYLQFINPTDIRVVQETCGSCHEAQVEAMASSVMTTNTGHYFPTLFLAGVQEDPVAKYGSVYISQDNCIDDADETSLGAKAACELTPLRSPLFQEVERAMSSGEPAQMQKVALEHYLSKQCNNCHQAAYPTNDAPGLYRSTGCASCHVLYSESGVYEGEDESISANRPVHPKRHELTKAIPTSQCARCHFQGGRIGLLFQGIREGGFGELLPNAETIDQPLYGHGPGFYVVDEDVTNQVDETPPDVHFQKGMHCADCHVGSDVHGTGQLHSSSKEQVDIQCEDCHGSVRAPAQVDELGQFRTSRGRVLPQLSQGEDGTIVLTGIVDGVEHEVPQPSALLQILEADSPMAVAMAPDAHGWSHADSLTCDACHTSYNQQCIGCHVTYDLRVDSVDRQTGSLTPGVTVAERMWTSLDSPLFGVRADGRIQSVLASQQVQLSIVGSSQIGGEGEILMGEQSQEEEGALVGEFRAREQGRPSLGFVPFFQHTTSAKPRPCMTCHRRDDTDEEMERVRGVYGFGTGEFLLPGPGGQSVDALRYLDDSGIQLTEWQQPGTGAIPPAQLKRALGVVLED